MGCGSSSDAKDQYANGEPTFEGDYADFKIDASVKGFDKDNGLLFRLIDKKKQLWAYYNDTEKYEMHIKVIFNADCELEALGTTELSQLGTGEWQATSVVAPGETAMFIKGRVNGFKAKMDAYPAGRAARKAADGTRNAKDDYPVEEATEEELATPVEVATPRN